MDFASGISNSSIVRCYGCKSWIRVFTTECVSTSDNGEAFSPQRWCFNCLSEVDEITSEAIKQFSDYPEGLPSWEKEEDEPEDAPDEDTGE